MRGDEEDAELMEQENEIDNLLDLKLLEQEKQLEESRDQNVKKMIKKRRCRYLFALLLISIAISMYIGGSSWLVL